MFPYYSNYTNIFTTNPSYDALFRLMDNELSHVSDWFALNLIKCK